MKRVGIDYGRPGLGFTCPNCKQVSQYPLIKLLCGREHELKVDEPELRLFNVYKLGKALQTVPRIIELLNAIKQKLTESERNCVLDNDSSRNEPLPPRTIEACLFHMDYPDDRREIVVVADDPAGERTGIWYQQKYPGGVKVLARKQYYPTKPSALNDTLTFCTGDIAQIT